MNKEKLLEGKEDLGQYSLLIEKCEQEIRNNIAAKEKLLEEKKYLSDTIDLISANILNERNPTCYGTDKRWANHLYPVYLTETFVKSNYINATTFLHLF